MKLATKLSIQHAEYYRKELNEKGEKTGKALGKHVISLYSTDICQVVKIRGVKKLRQDIKNNLIIKDQVAILGCLLVCTFSTFLAPVLFAAHTVNNLLAKFQFQQPEMLATEIMVINNFLQMLVSRTRNG